MDMENKLTHFDAQGQAIMVDISQKEVSERVAAAKGKIQVSTQTMEAVLSGRSAKGDVLGVARVAGIMGAKRTAELIPLCHPLMITKCAVDFECDAEACEIEATCTVSVTGKTGVEMEALTGATVALLTIYDMCKAIDKRMVIGEVRLHSKTGGKSGDFYAEIPGKRREE